MLAQRTARKPRNLRYPFARLRLYMYTVESRMCSSTAAVTVTPGKNGRPINVSAGVPHKSTRLKHMRSLISTPFKRCRNILSSGPTAH